MGATFDIGLRDSEGPGKDEVVNECAESRVGVTTISVG